MTPFLFVILYLLNVDAAAAGAWKACRFQNLVIGCRDQHHSDGSVRILWQDGRVLTYRVVKPGFPVSRLYDRSGQLWQREILVQGNAVFTNLATGQRFVVPLRAESQP